MSAVLPLVLAAGAATLFLIGRNIDAISPTAGARLDKVAASAKAALKRVGTGLKEQVAADTKRGGARKRRLKRGKK